MDGHADLDDDMVFFTYDIMWIIYDVVQKETSIRINYIKLGQTLKNLGFKQIMKKINGKVIRVYYAKRVYKANDNYTIQSYDKEPF